MPIDTIDLEALRPVITLEASKLEGEDIPDEVAAALLEATGLKSVDEFNALVEAGETPHADDPAVRHFLDWQADDIWTVQWGAKITGPDGEVEWLDAFSGSATNTESDSSEVLAELKDEILACIDTSGTFASYTHASGHTEPKDIALRDPIVAVEKWHEAWQK